MQLPRQNITRERLSSPKTHPPHLYAYTDPYQKDDFPTSSLPQRKPPASAAALLLSHVFLHHAPAFSTARFTPRLSPSLALRLSSSTHPTTFPSAYNNSLSSSSSQRTSHTSTLIPHPMSSSALPISPARFAAALSSLSTSSLHAKAAELRNSIAHLEKSNSELEEYVRAQEDDDRELYDAILENQEVIARMEERIELLRREVVEVRCLPWEPEGAKEVAEVEGERGGEGSAMNGVIGGEGEGEGRGQGRAQGETQRQTNGGADGEEGVFL